MKPRPVLVEWTDSCHLAPGAWLDRDAATEPGTCGIVSVGWLIGKTADTLTLAGAVTEADDVTLTFAIPRSCVTRMVRLKP